ncbi:dockerin type I repeat-containing protein [Ruminiclostridium josui]|uniref:dockerin type I repeat-containing protein n=1 Tax=Ruminiclostridium josui TaxID=1499 RepID=UPI001FA6BECD|nr:dockerin type I repeat-containing protein [Ruminiclostridium josui]
MLKQYLLGSITKFPSENGLTAADVNGSGTIDALDFAVMKQYLIGLISKFPAQV